MGTYPPNVYLVRGERVALIDAGYGDDAALSRRRQALAELGVARADYIVISHHHTDHRGGAEGLREATGGVVLAHAAEQGLAREDSSPIPADHWLEGETVLDLGGLHLELLHTPGHSPGHLCAYLRERGMLFSGDQVLGVGTTAIEPRHGDMAQHIASLARLGELELSLILPGHGPPIRQPRRKLQELIDHRHAREEQIAQLLRLGEATVEELVQEIYPELEPRLLDMARGQVRSHLIKMQREGRVVARPEDRYSLA